MVLNIVRLGGLYRVWGLGIRVWGLGFSSILLGDTMVPIID